jgi:hypothetical protein
MNQWRKFRRLPAEEKAVFLAAMALLPAVRVGLKTLGLRRVQAVLGGRLQPDRQAEPEGALHRARRTAGLVAVAARYAGGTCLARSIVLACLLERQGVSAQLRIGVRKGEQGFEAHAWVEAEGTVLNDGQDVAERFAAFDRNFALARVNWR